MNLFYNKSSVNENSFLRDPLLFNYSKRFPGHILAQLEDIGAFTVSSDARDLARLANSYRPRLCYRELGGGLEEETDPFKNLNPYIELHPAYHALVRRARDIGLATSLWETTASENGMRYEIRAAKLFLMAGLDSGHLQEVIHTSAGIAGLMNEQGLYNSFSAPLLSRKYDSSLRPMEEKAGASLGFCYQEHVEQDTSLTHRGLAHPVAGENHFSARRYALKAVKTRVLNPNADAFFVSAELQGALSCFFVPKFTVEKKINYLKITRLLNPIGEHGCPIASINFEGSFAWLIGPVGAGTKILSDIETMVNFDEAVVSAGVLRSAVNYGLFFLQHSKKKTPDLALGLRIFADIALDAAAAQSLVFRLARAFDNAAKDKLEAAFARIMTPVAAFWINNLVAPVVSEIIAQLGPFACREDGIFSRFLKDACHRQMIGKQPNQLIEDVVKAAQKAPKFFLEVLSSIEPYLGAAGPKTLEILHTATQIALSDIGTSRILVEQLAFAAACASLNNADMPIVANAFAESRLGGQWRSSYGMLSPRHNPSQILEALYGSM